MKAAAWLLVCAGFILSEGVSKCMLICILMHFLHFYEKRPELVKVRAFVIS